VEDLGGDMIILKQILGKDLIRIVLAHDRVYLTSFVLTMVSSSELVWISAYAFQTNSFRLSIPHWFHFKLFLRSLMNVFADEIYGDNMVDAKYASRQLSSEFELGITWTGSNISIPTGFACFLMT
jgi:hypothetical protein